jgi:hypothetical protein
VDAGAARAPAHRRRRQVGQGIAWGLFTFAGAAIGVYLFLRRDQPETEPATDAPVSAARAPA